MSYAITSKVGNNLPALEFLTYLFTETYFPYDENTDKISYFYSCFLKQNL